MSVIKPTVGRVVLFHPRGEQPGDQPCIGMVASVISDRCVNLAVWDAEGRPVTSGKQLVPLKQPGDEPITGGEWCEWMPFQIGQSAKYEQLQREVNAGRAQGFQAADDNPAEPAKNPSPVVG